MPFAIFASFFFYSPPAAGSYTAPLGPSYGPLMRRHPRRHPGPGRLRSAILGPLPFVSGPDFARLCVLFFCIVAVFFPCIPPVLGYIVAFSGILDPKTTLYRAFVMGDKPDKICWIEGCPASWFDDALEPAALSVNISGIQKGSSWDPEFGKPPDGDYLFKWVDCGRFVNTDIRDTGELYINLSELRLELYWYMGVVAYFRSAGVYDEIITFTDPEDPDIYPFYGGEASVDPYATICQLPESWDGADLIEVPKMAPYFAEELPTTLADRKNRYACHRDGTNIKIWFNQ